MPIDHRDLEDVFGNLLDNARKWARTRVQIHVRQENGSVEICVDDDGPGIPEGHIQDAVARGTRLDRTVPGTGVGLAIVRDLVELHGGRLALGQNASGGLRAMVILPLRSAAMLG